MNQTNNYTFLWGNHEPLITIEANINCFKKFKSNEWNFAKNIIEVAKSNNIRCFFSNEDIETYEELSKKFLNHNYTYNYISGLNETIIRHTKLFTTIRKTKIKELTTTELISLFYQVYDQWSESISYFRATQAEGTHYLIKELEKTLNPEQIAIVINSPKIDEINQEQIDWQKLINRPINNALLMEHAYKYPWTVCSHFTYEDALETLNNRYKYSQLNKQAVNIISEKVELAEKQKLILTKYPSIKPVVNTIQELALTRPKIKAHYAGSDFYLIPIIEEIAYRSKAKRKDIALYYLSDDVRRLGAEEIPLSNEEIEKRKRCFVGLWKDGAANYYSGDVAEKIAREELQELYEIPKISSFKGISANHGIAKGRVRFLPGNDMEIANLLRKNFQKGEILVTQMTQPNIVDIASRAGAIVTDEGGMLSHAAVISREFKIPCIVGTHIATQVLKDGDLVEVDANVGVVRILEQRRDR